MTFGAHTDGSAGKHLIRYTAEFTNWHKAKVHSGRHPLEYMSTEVARSPLRIKHLGWSREAERRRKHEWYLQIDDKPFAGNAALYSRIMDPNPTLKPWDPKLEYRLSVMAPMRSMLSPVVYAKPHSLVSAKRPLMSSASP